MFGALPSAPKSTSPAQPTAGEVALKAAVERVEALAPAKSKKSAKRAKASPKARPLTGAKAKKGGGGSGAVASSPAATPKKRPPGYWAEYRARKKQRQND